MKNLLLVFIVLSLSKENSGLSSLFVTHKWSQLEFDFPNETAREEAINSGEFKPESIFPIDVDIYQNTFFITIPRFQAGVPVTLGIVTNRNYNGNPIISAYPSKKWQTNFSNCKPDRIVSVFRIEIDKYDRLWVLDSGLLLEEIVCPPQILAFDLRTDTLIHRYEIPSTQYSSDSNFITPIVDYDCETNEVFVYAADCIQNSIVVHDVARRDSWLVRDESMGFTPPFNNFIIAGTSFTLNDGIFAMSVSPCLVHGDKFLFFHALASQKESRVRTSVLKNRNRFVSSSSAPQSFETYPQGRGTQSAAEAIDDRGIIYFSMLSNITINCWNTRHDYNSYNFGVVANNKQQLQFPSGMKIKKGVLFTITIRFQKGFTNTLNTSEENFRILRGNTRQLSYNTVCENYYV